MVRGQVIPFRDNPNLPPERHGHPIRTTPGQGYGRPEQRPGHFGSYREAVSHILRQS